MVDDCANIDFLGTSQSSDAPCLNNFCSTDDLEVWRAEIEKYDGLTIEKASKGLSKADEARLLGSCFCSGFLRRP